MHNGQSSSNPILSSISEMVDTPIIKALEQEYKYISKSINYDFPIDIFHPTIRQLIIKLEEVYNYPIAYTGSSILSACSTAIGGEYKVKVKNEWFEKCNLYMVLIGSPGAIKSHPISFAYGPVNRIDKELDKEYKRDIANYEKEKRDNKESTTEKPTYKEIIIDDFTPEALAKAHKNNPRGISIVVDELKGWLNNFTRYNGSSNEEQVYLTLWSGKTMKIKRASLDATLRIEDPFVNVIGSIQHKLIKDFAKGDRSDNGFLDRMIFGNHEEITINLWNDLEIDEIDMSNYRKLINNLFYLNELKEPGTSPIMVFSNEARKYLFKWQNDEELRLQEKRSDSEILIFRKIQIYAIRFCAILHLQDAACTTHYINTIDVGVVKRAVILTEYFRKISIKVRDSIENPNPIKGLSEEKKKTLLVLPEYFKTSEGVEIAISNGMTEITFKRFLNDKKIFKRVKQGHYQKLT